MRLPDDDSGLWCRLGVATDDGPCAGHWKEGSCEGIDMSMSSVGPAFEGRGQSPPGVLAFWAWSGPGRLGTAKPKSKLLVVSCVVPKLKVSSPGKSLLKLIVSSPMMKGGIAFPSGAGLPKSRAGKAVSCMGESFLLDPAKEKSFSGDVESAAGSQRSQSSQSSLV